MWSCLEQARSNTPAGATPCLIFSRNRSPTYAVVPWEVLLGLYAALYNSGEDGIPTGLSDILVSLEPYVTSEVKKRRRTESGAVASTSGVCEEGEGRGGDECACEEE